MSSNALSSGPANRAPADRSSAGRTGPAGDQADGTAPGDIAPGDLGRRIVRAADRALLASAQHDTDGWPYPSLVLTAADLDGTPILFISTLADHTRNIAAEARVGLLFSAPCSSDNPLSGPRVSLLGRAVRSEEPRHRARFLARHPGAALYAGFGDFSLYAVSVERAHLVAGFGRVKWLDRGDLLLPRVPAALAEAEDAILGHMNADHADALRLYATVLAGRRAGGGENSRAGGADNWTMTGIDPDGCDLRRSGEMARVDFDHSVENPEDARVTLAGLARQARRSAPGGADGSVDSNDRDG